MPAMPSRPSPDGPLVIDAAHVIPRDELEIKATRSGGPGGQHVNVTASRVEVRWNVRRTRALAAEERERVAHRLASRLDADGWLRVTASDTRSQHQNRELALARLAHTVARSLVVPKRRKKTRPTAASRERRLESKRRQSEKKRRRGSGGHSRNFD